MRFIFTAFLLLFILLSCSNQNQFPEKVSNKIPLEELKLSVDIAQDQFDATTSVVDFSKLDAYVSQYNLKDENFNLVEFENCWKQFSEKNNILDWNGVDLKFWAGITALLLELTNNTKYAEELEIIGKEAGYMLEKCLAPYVFTKRIDHIYVNLFQPLEINYEHTLGGKVKFWQETNYPKSGSVKLHFGMTERRYMELFIRIPSWADGTTVMVNRVKYFAAPGTYCKIAKKWKEGDLVEVEFNSNRTVIGSHNCI